MADETKVIDGTFRGVRIRIASGGVNGGRKTSIKRFPNRDTNTIEDLGGLPRSYQLEIIVSDVGGQDYFAYRDSLLAALEAKGVAVLEHPLYGRIENVVCTTFSLSENFSEFGRTIVSASFEISENTGIPQQTQTALSQLAAEQELTVLAVIADITDNFRVTTKFKDNFAAAVGKVDEIVVAARAATSFVGDSATDVNQIGATIDGIASKVNSLVTNPPNLADAISELFSDINEFTGTVENTAKSLEGFFGFGDDDTEIVETTAGRIERVKNNGILNGAVNAQSLAYAYTNTAQSTFETVDEIDSAANALEVQYQQVITNGASQAVKDALTDQRVVTQQFFDEQRITARQVITVFTPRTSTRLLSFQYYGDTESADEIGELNEFADVSFIEGNVKILTA